MILSLWTVSDWFERHGYQVLLENMPHNDTLVEYLHLFSDDSGAATQGVCQAQGEHCRISAGDGWLTILRCTVAQAVSEFSNMQTVFSQWERECLESLVYVRKFQHLVDITAKILPHPICVKNNEEIMFGQTEDFEHSVEKATAHVHPTKKHTLPEPSYRELQEAKDPILYYSPIYHSNIVQVNLWQKGQNVGKAIILENGIPFTQGDLFLLKKLSEFMNTFVAYDRSSLFSGTGVSTVLVDLVRSRQTSEENISSIYRVKHWSYEDEFIILCFQDVFDGETPLRRSLRSTLSAHFEHCQLIFYWDVLGIINVTKSGGYPLVIKQLETLLSEDGMLWGASYPFKGLERLSDFYHQAQIAMRYAKQSGQSYGNIFDCALPYMTNVIRESEHGEYMLHPDVGRLLSIDMTEGTEHARTLLNYLLSGCNYTDTAQKLGVHRNTIIYRIEKISNLMLTDLHDTENQKLLIFSCLIMESSFPSKQDKRG
ncbi:MAG: helix-turn-helix domain-containing protein [Oscillospiraceae bacterium]|nr:helix-turn-helix domain-containing protein [Oscillospiraceae bacterium]